MKGKAPEVLRFSVRQRLQILTRLCQKCCLTFAICTFVVLPGCSWLHESAINMRDVSSSDGVEEDFPKAPLDVQVSQAFVREGKLHVVVTVTPQIELEASHVAVAVSGLDEGFVKEEQIIAASDVVESDMLGVGDSVVMKFVLASDSLSEYQVRVSWGDEADQTLAQASLFQPSLSKDSEIEISKLAGLVDSDESEEVSQRASNQSDSRQPDQVAEAPINELSSNTVTASLIPKTESILVSIVKIDKEEVECQSPPCDVLFSLNASINNGQSLPISGITLGIGLFWVNEDEQADFPKFGMSPHENEELIDLYGLTIPPGESRRIRVRVDRSVPMVPGGEFVPNLRLVSYSEK